MSSHVWNIFLLYIIWGKDLALLKQTSGTPHMLEQRGVVQGFFWTPNNTPPFFCIRMLLIIHGGINGLIILWIWQGLEAGHMQI